MGQPGPPRVRAPEVVLVATDSHNVFGRPFIITRALTGISGGCTGYVVDLFGEGNAVQIK
jgi:hypothetical protein